MSDEYVIVGTAKNGTRFAWRALDDQQLKDRREELRSREATISYDLAFDTGAKADEFVHTSYANEGITRMTLAWPSHSDLSLLVQIRHEEIA